MTNMTVEKFMKTHTDRQYYLIPNELNEQGFNEPSYKYGHAVSSLQYLDNEIKDKTVTRSWIENDRYIIIWELTSN